MVLFIIILASTATATTADDGRVVIIILARASTATAADDGGVVLIVVIVGGP